MGTVSKSTAIITYTQSAGYSCSQNDRYDFISAVKQLTKRGDGEDICHYISFDYMKNVLTTSAQEFYCGHLTKAEFADNIRNLAAAVTSGERANATGTQKAAIDAVYTGIDECVNYIAAVTDNTQDMSGKLNELLYYLNSADANLRPGDAKWNRSLGNLYDPCDWVHCGPDGKIDSSNLKLDEDDLKKVYAKNCFYLVNDTDCKKYDLLLKLKNVNKPELYTAIYDGKPIIYSSCNFNFVLDSIDNYDACTDPIYYD